MIKLGIALCGSFCTSDKVIDIICDLKAKNFDITPIFSENFQNIDTRFGKSDEIMQKIIKICENKPITSIVDAEQIGPMKMFDALIIAPCTGNTLAKLANGITDNTVTMASKSHLRNERPLIIAISTNDGLSASSKNLFYLLNRKHFYFVPFGQDDFKNKPNSLVCDLKLLEDTISNALNQKQIQPILL